MFERWVESGLLGVLREEGVGCIAFSPLAQGMLTDKYLHGIPVGSRASKPHGFLRPEQLTPEKLEKVRRLNEIALRRGQTLAQLSLTWVLRNPEVTSVLIGASKVSQVEDAVGMLKHPPLAEEELREIEQILNS
jgi:L-glyceraldehyde 3-phosphate reductase